jgi:hypothetical protein
MLPPGYNTITIVYSGNSSFPGSSASYGLSVAKLAANVTLIANPTVTVFGQSLTLTAGVAASTQIGVAAPTGTIQFYNGSILLGTGTVVNGVATLTVTNLPVGIDALSLVYSGDANYNSFSGNTGLFNIGKALTAVNLTAATINEQETLTTTIGVVAPGA